VAVRTVSSRRSALCAVASAICIGVFMTGCGSVEQQIGASSSTVAIQHYRGLPAGISAPLPIPANPVDQAEWTGIGQFAIVTWGSSGCPRLPAAVKIGSPDMVVVTITAGDYSLVNQGCPADLSPTTSLLAMPSAADTDQPLELLIVDGIFSTTVTLPSRVQASGS
jgi:hypothetical protein